MQRLPELLGRVVQGDTGEWGGGKVVDQIVEEILQRATGDAGCRDSKVQRDCLASSRHLEQFPLSTGPALDLASNEVDLAYFTVVSLCAARISLLRLLTPGTACHRCVCITNARLRVHLCLCLEW